MPATSMVHRVVRYRIDVEAMTVDQRDLLARHAGTARAVWNWALALRNQHADARWDYLKKQATRQGGNDEAKVAELLRDPVWRRDALKGAPDDLRQSLSWQRLGLLFTTISKKPGYQYAPWAVDPRPGRFAWWQTEHGVSRFAVSSALRDLDAAFDRFYKNTGGHRSTARSRPRKDGRPAAWPRFKKKSDGKDAFSIFNLAIKGQDPWRVVSGGHRIKIPNVGSIRVHENTKRLRRLIKREGWPKSARFTRSGGSWYVSIVVALPAPAPGTVLTPTGASRSARPTRPQRQAGLVGVDLGVSKLATLSNGDVVENPRYGRAIERRLARLQRRLSRQQGPTKGRPPSAGWLATKTAINRLQHRTAVRRRATVHELTKQLAARYAVIGIEDLNVRGMTGTPAAVPDPERPGAFLANGAAAKSGLNRAILDVGFGEFRRQLTYKSSWYGSTLVPVARFAPTSKTCSVCGEVKPTLRLAERTYRCDICGLVIDRDLNAARNLARLAGTTSPPDGGDAKRQDAPSATGEPGTDQVLQNHGPPWLQEPATDSSSLRAIERCRAPA